MNNWYLRLSICILKIVTDDGIIVFEYLSVFVVMSTKVRGCLRL